MKGQAMTDTRQALEEAWDKIHPMPELSDIVSRDQFLMAMEVSWPARSRFRRFLDAEAWTDAALILVPEGKCWHIRYDPRLTGATVMDQDGFNQHHTLAETPALALLEACLEARENADG